MVLVRLKYCFNGTPRDSCWTANKIHDVWTIYAPKVKYFWTEQVPSTVGCKENIVSRGKSFDFAWFRLRRSNIIHPSFISKHLFVASLRHWKCRVSLNKDWLKSCAPGRWPPAAQLPPSDPRYTRGIHPVLSNWSTHHFPTERARLKQQCSPSVRSIAFHWFVPTYESKTVSNIERSCRSQSPYNVVWSYKKIKNNHIDFCSQAPRRLPERSDYSVDN